MDFTQAILSAAKSVKISGAILLAVCTHESRLNNVVAVHDGGSPSYGICQVKKETAEMFGYKGGKKGLMNPEINAKYAALYLKYQYDRYQNWCMAVAAYNAGRYNESRREPGHPRNIKYVKNVKNKLKGQLRDYLSCDTLQDGGNDVAENNGIGRRVQPAEPENHSNWSGDLRPTFSDLLWYARNLR